MKKNILIFGLAILLLFSTNSCKNSFYDVNNNPNQAVDVTGELILPVVLVNTASYLNSNFQFLNLWMGYWNWSGNYSIGISDKNYQFTNGYQNGVWLNMYNGILNNLNTIDSKSAVAGEPITQGMAKIMKAFCFGYLVDTYNNIPYSDALKGTSSIQPKYDNAQSVYEDLITQLDAGLLLLSKTDGTHNPGTNDVMFGGDISKWQKFANTVKLRLLLRQSEMSGRTDYIKTQIAKITASGYGFLGAGQGAMVNPGYTQSTGKMNPFWETYGQNAAGTVVEAYNISRANIYGINFYKNTKDPRLAYFYAPVGGTGTNFNGTAFGTINVLANNLTSGIGPGLLKSFDQSSTVLGSHESLFLQAEAAYRGWISGDPKALYEAAVTESFINLGVADATNTAKAYLAQTQDNVNYDASTDKLKAIITQKWASLNGLNPFEAWSDYRRLGMPNIPVSVDPSVTIKEIPYRLLYPQSEINTNGTNVNAQGTISQFTSKIFWIK